MDGIWEDGKEQGFVHNIIASVLIACAIEHTRKGDAFYVSTIRTRMRGAP